ncbi:sulfatase-like hydrolase/transferase [Marinoscillum furvescens]|uniref:Arylsulfatase A-like enzyme n=1 Tax=Marinoscillum furvescens DSM 4134 TaxID=1122208 RepID=A0A3D9L1P6_MARFU|nr:sulfatase-like hydrolase/transferase [Marinoscillum furvescens]RED96006.1 arylsulfatase A-like enzyme [Marinoscillum furvescens DSM 4134]
MQRSITVIFCLFILNWIQAQPNILFIESDDQSNQALQAFGYPNMVTPNLDQLVKEGVSFTAAYNMGCWSPAVCVPSRTMLFYGKYLWDSQKINKKNAPRSMPEVLKENGYATYMTGKWHAWGKPVVQLFDNVGSVQPGQLKSYYTEDGHVTDITGQEAVSFIENYDSENPYFLYVAFNAPHVPRQTNEDYYDLYPEDEIPLPPSVRPGPLNPNVAYNYTNAPMSLQSMKKRRQQNNAMVTHMDERIGDIIKALKASGDYENTIIVFMSDHGISFGENGVAGKVCLYEPSVTAPLVIKAPGLPEGKQLGDRVYLQDVYPTLLELLGIRQPEYLVFESLLPVIKTGQNSRKSIYLAMFDDQRAIISGDDKLIWHPKSGDLELYDLGRDPWETTNLIERKAAQQKIESLVSQFQTWQQQTGDQLTLSPSLEKYLR